MENYFLRARLATGTGPGNLPYHHGRRYCQRAVTRSTQFRLLIAFTVAWAVWAGWSLLGRATPFDLLVLDDLGTPVAAANVDMNGTQVGRSGSDGTVPLEWKSSSVLEVSAPGHVTRMVNVSERPEGTVNVVLTARVFRARIVDPDGDPVPAARVAFGAVQAFSDDEGRVVIRGAEPGEITVNRPAWSGATHNWAGGSGEDEIQIEPFLARAVHITGDAVRDRFSNFIGMALDTELNALMVDLKDEAGLIWFQTTNPVAVEIGAAMNAWDLRDVVAQAAQNDLYVIGRLVLFTDPIAAVKKPSMAVWDTATNGPFSWNGQFFLDPTDADARKYGLDLAVEVCGMGIDEVQFDYVRFPDRRPESVQFDGGVSYDVRVATINAFLEEAVELLHPMGCAVGADVFGFITRQGSPDDGGIGQNWEAVARIVDVISPMVYPSHYSTGWYGFEVPNNNPGPMVRAALTDGLNRLPRNVIVRPWLQDFSSYGPTEVRAQIDVAEEFGMGWMLWNSVSNVTVDALGPPR